MENGRTQNDGHTTYSSMFICSNFVFSFCDFRHTTYSLRDENSVAILIVVFFFSGFCFEFVYIFVSVLCMVARLPNVYRIVYYYLSIEKLLFNVSNNLFQIDWST